MDGRLDDRVDEGGQPGGAQGCTGQVQPGAGAVTRLGDEQQPRDQRDQDDRHVDPEDRRPGVVLQQQPADDRPERDADRGAAGPDRDGPALLRRREDDLDDRQGRRHDQRRADAHADTGGDEGVDGRRQRRHHRGGAEHDQAESEQAPAAEPVPEPAGEQQEPAEGQGVGVDRPLQVRPGRAQVALQRRQRDVEDQRVQADDDQAQDQYGQDPPAPRVPDLTVHGSLPQ